MSTKIPYCDETLNPVVGCWGPGGTSKAPARCPWCYAVKFAARGMSGCPQCKTFEPHFHPERLEQLKHWKKPRVIFIGSMTDLFHPEVPNEWILKTLMACNDAPQHFYLFLTQNPKRYQDWDGKRVVNFPPQCAIGATIRNLAEALKRSVELLGAQGDGLKHWLSLEPLVSPIKDFPAYLFDQIIFGGMNGPSARPMHPEWVREVIKDCKAGGTPFYFKGWGAYAPATSGIYIGDVCVSPYGYFETWKKRMVCFSNESEGEHMRKTKTLDRLVDGIEHNDLIWRLN